MCEREREREREKHRREENNGKRERRRKEWCGHISITRGMHIEHSIIDES